MTPNCELDSQGACTLRELTESELTLVAGGDAGDPPPPVFTPSQPARTIRVERAYRK